jgi:predicted DsbA family dithiol-disulfide isomerase
MPTDHADADADTAAPTDDVTVTVYSDYVCPFCYLGRESLRQYRTGREGAVRVDWHPFDLRAGQRRPDGSIDPDADDGKDEAYFEQAAANVRRLADEYGVEMDLSIARDVDSLPAQAASHAVLRSASYDYDDWLAFDEALLAALWRDAHDIGDVEVLVDVATEVGIDPGTVRTAVDDPAVHETLAEAFERARKAGVSGVPTFVYEGYAARGAVPPEHLARLVEGA